MISSRISRLGIGVRLVGVALPTGETKVAHKRAVIKSATSTSLVQKENRFRCDVVGMPHYTGWLPRGESLGRRASAIFC